MQNDTHESPRACFNPHACTDSENPYENAPPMWRKEPAEFLAYHRGTMESISAGVESAMRTLRNSPADRACMLRLLCTLSDMVPSYRRGDACEFLEFGPALIPSSPLGLRTLRVLRADASAFIQEQNPLGLCAHEPDSMLGKLAHAFAESKGRSALVQSLRNDTSKSESGFRFNVSTDARAFASMPRGEQAPAPILSPALVGYEITDAREFQDECGMCEEGTLDFVLFIIFVVFIIYATKITETGEYKEFKYRGYTIKYRILKYYDAKIRTEIDILESDIVWISDHNFESIHQGKEYIHKELDGTLDQLDRKKEIESGNIV